MDTPIDTTPEHEAAPTNGTANAVWGKEARGPWTNSRHGSAGRPDRRGSGRDLASHQSH